MEICEVKLKTQEVSYQKVNIINDSRLLFLYKLRYQQDEEGFN